MNRLVLTEDMINKYIYVVVEARRQNYISATFKDSLGVKVKERQAPSAPAITAKLNNSTGADYVSGSWTNQNVWIGLRSEDNFGILRYEFSSTSQSIAELVLLPQDHCKTMFRSVRNAKGDLRNAGT